MPEETKSLTPTTNLDPPVAMLHIAEAIHKVAGILENMPTRESQLRVLATTAMQVGAYDLAYQVVRELRNVYGDRTVC